MATTPTNQHDRMLLEAARLACLRAAADAYEDAGIRGLCGDGRWEYALEAIRMLDLEAVLTSWRSSNAVDRSGEEAAVSRAEALAAEHIAAHPELVKADPV